MITTRLIEPFKAQVFVAHVQNHLNRGEYGVVDPINPLRSIPIGMVGCKICEKGINQIYEEEKALYDAKGAEKK